jgi:hypothetical protein
MACRGQGLQPRARTIVSFMPNPGSIVRLKSGQLALVTKVTPLGDDDRVLLLGLDTRFQSAAWEVTEVLFEPEAQSQESRPS